MALELFVYADESGIQGDSPYCIMAGYIASPQQWKKFNAAWAEILERYEVPEFHAKDFFARRKRGYYEGWLNRRSMQFVVDLATLIHRHRLSTVFGGVEVAAFNALTEGERRFMTGGAYTSRGKWILAGAPTRPYRFAAFCLIREAVDQARDGSLVHFVFDRQSEYEGGTLQEFDAMMRSGMGADKVIDTTKLGSLVFANRRHEVSLQAADLLVHCWYNDLTGGNVRSLDRAVAMDILATKRNVIHVYKAGDFESFFQTAAKYGIDREQLRKL